MRFRMICFLWMLCKVNINLSDFYLHDSARGRQGVRKETAFLGKIVTLTIYTHRRGVGQTHGK